MKYKTLVRIALKVLGAYLVVIGLGQLVSALLMLVGLAVGVGGARGLVLWHYLSMVGSPVVQICLGCYLFFAGTWVVNKIIPSNRPYCPECGYELTGLTGPRCPECGTQLPPGWTQQPSRG